MNLISDLLRYSGLLHESLSWPGLSEVYVRELIITENGPTSGQIPLILSHLITKYLRSMEIDHRTDWLGIKMDKSAFKRQFNDY